MTRNRAPNHDRRGRACCIWALGLSCLLWVTPAPGQGLEPEFEGGQPEQPEEAGPVPTKPRLPTPTAPGQPVAGEPAPEAPVEAPKEAPPVELRPVPAERIRGLKERLLDVITTDTGTNATEFLRRIQLQNEFRELRGPAQLNLTTLRVDYPILGGGGVLRVDVPFSWFDPNTTGEKTSTGLGDILFRTGYRFVNAPGFKLFIGGDLIFPTATDSPLGRGKYQAGPGFAASIPVAGINTNFFPLVQQFWSFGGDPSRPAVDFTKFEVSATIPWTAAWWTTLDPFVNVDWTKNGKTAMNVEFEVGRTLGPHYRTWVRGGAGLWGEGVVGGYDWILQVGVRYMF